MRISPEAGSKCPLRSAALCVTLALWVLAAGSAYGQGPTPTPTPAAGAGGAGGNPVDKLKKQLAFEIDDPRVAVDAAILDDRAIVTLTGDLNTEQEAQDIVELVKSKVTNGTQIRPRFFLKKPPTGVKPPEEEITDLWILTYIRSRVSSTSGATGATSATGSAGSAGSTDSVELLVDALNEIYGSSGKPAVQRAGVGRLLLRGTRTTVLDIKRFLALIDAPWPQVQMNLWAVQVSGSRQEVAERTEQIGKQVRAVRDQMQEVQRELARIVVNDRASRQQHWDFVQGTFDQIGVALAVDDPLSLNEALILLTLHPGREQKIAELQEYATKRWPTWERQWLPAIPVAGREPADCLRAATQAPASFNRLRDVLASARYEADKQGFLRFAGSLYCFKDRTKWRERPDAPSSLARTGAVVDRVLKSAMDAFAADMADLFLDPLLCRLQATASGGKDDGITLVGRSRIVVTSGLEAGLAPEMASYVESGRPKPFGKELLDLAFPASQSGTTTTEGVLTGAGKVLAGLSDGQALALAALLSAETEPAYTKVAPGIAINIRPSVLPDGGAARLTIDARFGVASTPLDEDRTDIWRQAPPAGISSHNVRTDAAVSAFDLFDISSFSVTASHPQTPYYVPILGRLPIIGKAFQFPRRNKETEFESLVLVNTVILPRSLELHRFYGREMDLPENQEMEKACDPSGAATATAEATARAVKQKPQ